MNLFDTPEEAIQDAIKNSDGMIEFDGQNCEDVLDEGSYCAGWDGESRRCDCGNRRVYWDTEQTGLGKFYAIARAY